MAERLIKDGYENFSATGEWVYSFADKFCSDDDWPVVTSVTFWVAEADRTTVAADQPVVTIQFVPRQKFFDVAAGANTTIADNNPPGPAEELFFGSVERSVAVVTLRPVPVHDGMPMDLRVIVEDGTGVAWAGNSVAAVNWKMRAWEYV